MAKLTKISLQNFKFFRQREEFVLDGRHLLIYGENGSGKSSVYWSLYTLLECANKDTDASIEKYFMAGNDACLSNIFLKDGDVDFVESEILLEMDDGTSFQLSANDRTIKDDAEAQASNYASEFLNYKMLFRIHDFVHSDEIDLMPYFEKEVLPYVKFSPISYWKKLLDGTLEEHETENAKQIYEFVKNEPPKSSVNKQGSPQFPRKKEPEYKTYENIVNGFKTELESLLTYINTEGNPILKDEFESNFEFRLDFEEVNEFKITAQKFTPPEFKIKLSIPTFHGETDIPKPHTFLNEARLSALGLSIRFAILKRRMQIAKLKIVLLDDFMISLDMNNRDVALDYIFDKVTADYQTIILTHDRHFYSLTKNKIQRKGQDWKCYEMFEAFDDETNPAVSKPKPCIIEDKGKVDKAWILFRLKDYASAGNMVRKAAEKLCKAYLTPQERLGGDYFPMKLDGQLQKFLTKGTANGLNAQTLADLKDYKDRIMNPSSHYDIETPLFRNELRKAIETLDKLKIETGILDL